MMKPWRRYEVTAAIQCISVQLWHVRPRCHAGVGVVQCIARSALYSSLTGESAFAVSPVSLAGAVRYLALRGLLVVPGCYSTASQSEHRQVIVIEGKTRDAPGVPGHFYNFREN